MRTIDKLALAGILIPIALSAVRADTTPPKKDGSKGTNQMAGANGKFGVTYTLTDNNGMLINYTILSAAYKIEPIWYQKGNIAAPNATHKVLEIHYKVKNPQSVDMYYNGNDYLQVVDAQDEILTTNDGQGRNVVTDSPSDGTLKPGQGISDLVTYAIVPGQGAVSKLILTLGRAGVNEKVLRFPIGDAPNVIKPLAAPYADPSDATGITAAASIPATFGTKYVSGYFDFTASAPTLVAGPLGSHAPEDGKKFLTVLIDLTNKTEASPYVSGEFKASVTDTDGDTIAPDSDIKPAHDDTWEGRSLDPGASTSLRLVFQVPSDATLQKLNLATELDNSGNDSQNLVYDISGVK